MCFELNKPRHQFLIVQLLGFSDHFVKMFLFSFFLNWSCYQPNLPCKKSWRFLLERHFTNRLTLCGSVKMSCLREGSIHFCQTPASTLLLVLNVCWLLFYLYFHKQIYQNCCVKLLRCFDNSPPHFHLVNYYLPYYDLCANMQFC